MWLSELVRQSPVARKGPARGYMEDLPNRKPVQLSWIIQTEVILEQLKFQLILSYLFFSLSVLLLLNFS